MTAALKQSLRSRIKAAREQLPAEARAALSAAITERLVQLPDYREAAAVLGYMNFGAEYESSSWVGRVLAEGKRLALPKVNRHTDHLDLYWVEDIESQLASGLWGIREPVVERCEKLLAPDEIEFALLPGVAFTRGGARLGYGGGYYDKLLGGMARRPVLAAAAFALQVADVLPQEPTDIGVAWIITEHETIACAAQ